MNSLYLDFILLLLCRAVRSDPIQTPPKITKQPPPDELLFQVALRLDENDKPFIVECEADAEPPAKYKWFKNGKVFDWQAYDNRMSQQPGRGTLVITSPKDEDLGYYQCFASNVLGTAMSNSVHVRKSDLNAFKEEPPQFMSVNEGMPFLLKCEPPDGYPKPQVYWMIQNNNGALRSINSSRMTVDPEGTLFFSNVTRADTSKDFLYACSATSLFRNEYKLGNKVKLNVLASGSSSVQSKHPPIKQYVSRKNFVAQRGEKAELWCVYGGTPLPEILWQKKGGSFDWGRYTTTNYGKTLVINSVEFEDEGFYECTASNGVGLAQSYSVNLKVEARPYFLLEPKDFNGAEDETAMFECEANGEPKPIVEWFHNGKPLAEAEPNSRRTLTSDNKIVIRSIVKGDTGNYACNASNTLGYAFKDVYLNVLALPPTFTKYPSNVATVDGKNVIMTCELTGAPKPEIRWLKNGAELTGGRFTVLDNGNLEIRNVIFVDDGDYTCLASNKFGKANATASLVVKERTRILDGPENYEVAAGSSATFRCIGVSDSTLDLDIQWLNDGEAIDFDQELRFIKSSDSSLTITKTTELDSGTYTCLAKTDLDEAEASAYLIVQDVPNSPKLISVSCNDKDAVVQWEPQGDNRAAILYYTIQYNTSFTPDTWENAYSNVNATDKSVKVGMSPWANYTFRVIARNKIGPSPPSQHSKPPCLTPGQVPESNPNNVEGKGTRPDNLVIGWTPMPQIEHNGPGFMYMVHWMRDLPGESWNIQQIGDWQVSQFVVSDQPTFQRYRIKVVAHNKFGESNVAVKEVVGYSGEDVPTEAPQNFSIMRVMDSKSAMFAWDPVSPDSLRGHFRGYKIQTWVDGDSEKKLRETIIEPTVARALVRKFIPFSVNKVRILAFNGQYNGPPSETLTFNTPEGNPGPVDSFEAIPMGSSAFMLVWNKPRQPNGNLLGFKIHYQTVNDTKLGPIRKKPDIQNPDQTRVKLAGLQSNTKYRITIRAFNQAGDGNELFIEESTRDFGSQPPDSPRFTLDQMPGENGLASVHVKWIPQGEHPGSHFFVQYREVGAPQFQSTEEEKNEDYIVIRGLDPAAVYEFRVVAVDGNFFTESEIEEMQTWGPGSGLYAQQTDDLSTAGWFIGMIVAIALLILILILVCLIKRNRAGKYAVHEREAAQGREFDYPEEGGFHEYTRPLDVKGSRGSLASSAKVLPESDTDSMAEYGEGETEGMNEDGSFIGQYGEKKRHDERSTGFATLV